MKISVNLAVLSLSWTVETALAYPTGAGSCVTDGPSVSESHLTNMPIVNMSLADAGYELVINAGAVDGGKVLETDNVAGVTLKGSYSFTVRATGNATFKGILMRFSDEEIGGFEPDDEAILKQWPDFCMDYPSLTHTDPSTKTEVTGLMTFEKVGMVNLLVDVVGFNNQIQGSSFAYSTYGLAVMEVNMTTPPPPPIMNLTDPGANVTTPVGNATSMTPSMAPSLVPVVSNMTSPAPSNTTNSTLPPPMGGGGAGKAPETEAPMSSNATSAAPSATPMTNSTNATSIAPSTAPSAPKVAPAAPPTKAPTAKISAPAPTSSAAGNSAVLYATAAVLVVVATMW